MWGMFTDWLNSQDLPIHSPDLVAYRDHLFKNGGKTGIIVKNALFPPKILATIRPVPKLKVPRPLDAQRHSLKNQENCLRLHNSIIWR
jgi:hypothetical protein